MAKTLDLARSLCLMGLALCGVSACSSSPANVATTDTGSRGSATTAGAASASTSGTGGAVASSSGAHGSAASSSASSSASTTAGTSSASGSTSASASSGTTGASASTGAASAGSTSGGTTGSVTDPTLPGPFPYAELDGSFTSTVDSSNVPVHVAYPQSGPTPAPYPVLLFAHGFQIDQSEYYSYLQQAASFGYVALTVNFPTDTFSSDDVRNRTDLLSGLDWLAGQSSASGNPLTGLANVQRTTVSGHSLGGKIAILAAAFDTRIIAALTFDPVDSSMKCTSTTACPPAFGVLPLPIPIGFLGETLDETGSFGQACAPAGANYQYLYGATTSPSFAVTVLGAGHVSFLDSLSACGLFCNFCQTPTAPQAQVLGISHAYLASFLERYVRGNTGYDSYLTGAKAQQLFVSTNEATIVSK